MALPTDEQWSTPVISRRQGDGRADLVTHTGT